MPLKQGDLALLNDPVAQELLHSTIPARLAYLGRDGTPRVQPTWFHWNGAEIVLGTALHALKVQALVHHPQVALTIDRDTRPYKVLQIRGTAQVETVQGVVPEYAAAAQRYARSADRWDAAPAGVEPAGRSAAFARLPRDRHGDPGPRRQDAGAS